MSAAAPDVVILAGGLGTRLGAVLGGAPKPMAVIGGKPFLEILVEQAARQGFRRFILCVGHGAAAVEGHFKNRDGLSFEFSRETSPLGTGGALKLCEPLRRSPVSLVMNGDSYCDLDLRGLLGFSARRGGVGALAVVPAGDRTDGGSVEFGADGRIAAFLEKAGRGSPHLSAGIYALTSAAFAAIPAGRPSSVEKEVFPSLLEAGLFAFPAAAPLYDIGTPERLETFRRVFAAKS